MPAPEAYQLAVGGEFGVLLDFRGSRKLSEWRTVDRDHEEIAAFADQQLFA